MEAQNSSGRHQNTRRMATVLDCLAHSPEQGLRLIDVARETGLGKATAHRILAGLVENDLADQDAATGRFFIGLRIMNWAIAGRKRFGLAEQMKPVLNAICEKSGDTVYLTVRQGDEAVYIDRREGSYPLKALPVDVGARRPLGIGAAPMAILAFQSDTERQRILRDCAELRRPFGIDNGKFVELIERAISLGYSLHVGEVLPGMVAVGVPVMDSEGVPVAAISVAAAAARIPKSRQDAIANLIREEILSVRVQS